jgi:hypothetical protein
VSYQQHPLHLFFPLLSLLFPFFHVISSRFIIASKVTRFTTSFKSQFPTSLKSQDSQQVPNYDLHASYNNTHHKSYNLHASHKNHTTQSYKNKNASRNSITKSSPHRGSRRRCRCAFRLSLPHQRAFARRWLPASGLLAARIGPGRLRRYLEQRRGRKLSKRWGWGRDRMNEWDKAQAGWCGRIRHRVGHKVERKDMHVGGCGTMHISTGASHDLLYWCALLVLELPSTWW